jgi:hypothetical protein
LASLLENRLHTSDPRVHSPSNVYRSSQERKKERKKKKANRTSSLCCSLSPVVVDTVLQLNNSQVSDFER